MAELLRMSESAVLVETPEPSKPCERLTLVVEFHQPMDHAALGELIAAVKLYGTVTAATHAVLRRTKRALV